MERIKVLIADDHPLTRKGLMEGLGEEESLEIVGAAYDGNEAVEKARALRPQLVLMDLNMPNCDGVEATRRLQTEIPEIKILIHTISEEKEDLYNSVQAGARGYILKAEPLELLVHAIEYVARGGILISSAMANKLVADQRLGPVQSRVAEFPMSPSEQAYLRQLAQGAGDKVATVGDIDTSVPEEGHTEPSVVVNGRATVERNRGEWSEDTLVRPKGGTDSVGVVTTAAANSLEGLVELVISPPVQADVVLMLNSWLKEVGNPVIGEMTGVTGGDIVLTITFSEPIPIRKVLADLPDVVEVTEETNTSGTMPKRFRLVLKSA